MFKLVGSIQKFFLKRIIGKIIVSRPFQLLVVIALFSASLVSNLNRNQTLEKTIGEQESKLNSVVATQVAQAESIVAFETRIAETATQLAQAEQSTPTSNPIPSPQLQPPSPTPIIPIAIDATKDWQSTGVFVHAGDIVSIRVVGGKWTAYREKLSDEARRQLPQDLQNQEIWWNIWSENAGEGMGVKCNAFSPPKPDNPCPVPTYYAGGLVAKIGIAVPFGVGDEPSDFPAPDDGIIYLRINDGQSQGVKYLDDNAGVLAVEIIVKR